MCLEEGAIRHVSDLEDPLHLSASAQASVAEGPSKDTPYATKRTESWLRAGSSQLHIAMNSPETGEIVHLLHLLPQVHVHCPRLFGDCQHSQQNPNAPSPDLISPKSVAWDFDAASIARVSTLQN